MRVVKLVFISFMLFSLIRCASSPKAPQWIHKSDKIAKQYTLDVAQFYPEQASFLGFRKFDSKGTDPSLETKRLYEKNLQVWTDKLEKLVTQAKNHNYKIDLEILLDEIYLERKSYDLDKKYKLVPFTKASRSIYNGLAQLINDQSSKKRKTDAIDRFKFYMSSNKDKKTFIKAALHKTKVLQKKYQGKTTAFSYPSKKEVKKYLDNSPSYVSGIKELLSKTPRKDWKEDYKKFQQEISKYDAFIKAKVLPLASKKVQISKDHYALALKTYGNDSSPQELLKIGKKDFKKNYKKLKALAEKIAEQHKLKKRTPFYVSQYFKRNLASTTQAVEKLYIDANKKLSKIILDHKLVSLPKKPLKIRVAGLAESKATPIPHLKLPPLLNNEGEVPEFVVPTSENGKFPFNDFNSHNFAMALTAHEGRPGHDLQFRRILESPISSIRATYAHNSVNTEGWALYAESIVYPYLSTEEKFSNLQSRLWRIARYFLDPMVQLGQANKGFVIQILHKQLGISKALAEAEYERYAYRLPGQAPSYYQGYKNILDIKKLMKKATGKLNEKCFNDTLLSFGLLPHHKILLFKDHFKKCQMQKN